MSANRRGRARKGEPTAPTAAEAPGEVLGEIPIEEEVDMAEEEKPIEALIEAAGQVEPEVPPEEVAVEEEAIASDLGAASEETIVAEEVVAAEETPPAEAEPEAPPEETIMAEEEIPAEEEAGEEVSQVKIETVARTLYQMGLEAGLAAEESARQVGVVQLPAFVGTEGMLAFRQAIVAAYEEGMVQRVAALKKDLGL